MNGRTVCLKFGYAAYILNARDEKVSDENSNLCLISLIIIPFFSDRVSFVNYARKRIESKSLNLYAIRRIRIWPCKKSRVSRLGEERFRHQLDQWPQPAIKSNAALPFCFLISSLSLFAALLCLATGSATIRLAPCSNPFINRNSMSRENASDTPHNSYFSFEFRSRNSEREKYFTLINREAWRSGLQLSKESYVRKYILLSLIINRNY